MGTGANVLELFLSMGTGANVLELFLSMGTGAKVLDLFLTTCANILELFCQWVQELMF